MKMTRSCSRKKKGHLLVYCQFDTNNSNESVRISWQLFRTDLELENWECQNLRNYDQVNFRISRASSAQGRLLTSVLRIFHSDRTCSPCQNSVLLLDMYQFQFHMAGRRVMIVDLSSTGILSGADILLWWIKVLVNLSWTIYRSWFWTHTCYLKKFRWSQECFLNIYARDIPRTLSQDINT